MAGSSPSLQISAGIRAHIIEDTGTILVGTRDAHLIPEITRGWGPTILPDGHTIDLCISLSAGAKDAGQPPGSGRNRGYVPSDSQLQNCAAEGALSRVRRPHSAGLGVVRTPEEYFDGTGEGLPHPAEHRTKDLTP